MVSLWKFFLDKKQFSVLLITALAAAGFVSIIVIPKESAPEVEVPIGIVSTVLPGGSAQDVERLVTNKIEDELVNLEDLDTVTSTSREGLSVVVAQFEASADLDQSIQDVKDAVDRAKVELPEEAKEPNVSRVNFADQPIIITSISVDRPARELVELGEQIKNEIKAIHGISRVEVTGIRERETQVVVRPEALASYGLNLSDAIAALGSNNASFPIGAIETSGVNYAIQLRGDISDPSEVARIPVGNRGGTPIYLGDIALVSDGLERPLTTSRVSVAGAPSEQALTLLVFKKSGGDVTEIADNVNARLDELKDTLLAGSTVLTTFDRGDLVDKDLGELSRTGLYTVLLVMVALLITIGWRESLVAGLSIPLSFLIAFIGLLFSGNTINFVSLFSLILAIGILVDSGIVVVEAIQARTTKYGSAYKAAIASLEEYAWPLIAGTTTTIAVFVPLFFISGITGKFIASIPFTVIFVLIASIVVALGMVPLFAILFTREKKSRMERVQEEYTERAKQWYKTRLSLLLENRRLQNWFLRLIVVAFIVALASPAVGFVKVIFFPQGDVDFVLVEVEKPHGTTLAESDLFMRGVEDELYGNSNIESFVTTIGQSSQFSENVSSDTKLANITVNLRSDRTKTSSEIVGELRAALAPFNTQATVRVSEPNNGPPVGAPILIKFTGNDLDAVEQTVSRAEDLLKSIEGTKEVTTSMKDNGVQIVVTVDKAKAAAVGLSPAIVAGTLRAAINGTTATVIKKQDKDIDVVVKMALGDTRADAAENPETTADALRQIPLRTPTGQNILLGSVVTVGLEKSNASISHENRERIGSVSAALAPNITAQEVRQQFEAREEELHTPEGVSVTFGGENEEVDQSFRDMFFALLAGMGMMLAILVLEFNSFRFTFYLLSIVPLSLIGVLLGLGITGQPLSFPSMLGFIALAGVIINHGIISLDSMIHYLRRSEGVTLLQVVVDSAAVRLRPIFLTTITTVVGMIPLVFVSELWAPLAFAIMFGLLFATVLTLILLPILFYRWPGALGRELAKRQATQK